MRPLIFPFLILQAQKMRLASSPTNISYNEFVSYHWLSSFSRSKQEMETDKNEDEEKKKKRKNSYISVALRNILQGLDR